MFRILKRGGGEKKIKERCPMSFVGLDIIGHRREVGMGSWVVDKEKAVASHCISSCWWASGLGAEAAVPSSREQADDFGKGPGHNWGYFTWAL